GVFLLQTRHDGHELIDMISYENGKYTLLTDDIQDYSDLKNNTTFDSGTTSQNNTTFDSSTTFTTSQKNTTNTTTTFTTNTTTNNTTTFTNTQKNNNIFTTFYLKINDFLIERQKTGIEKKRQSRQKQLEKEIQMNEHQKNLMENLNDEMIKYHSLQSNLESNLESNFQSKNILFYEKETQLIRKSRIFIDKKNFSILIPIKSYMVPFHIEFLKNCSINQNDLRINFKDTEILKSITFRSKYSQLIFNEINDLKKNYFEKKEISNIQNQGNLIEKKGKKFILNDVKIKTENKSLKKNKKNILELHQNGFKFNDLIILFQNIDHLFYQQGDIFLLHFKLKNPIIFNCKKCFHIQFYKEVIENLSVDISKYVNSEKEKFEEEQEKIRFELIKEEYNSFIKNLENSTSLRVDRISTEIYFEGVPFRSNVQIRPSSICLVSLQEPPFLIIDFEKIEIVNFERVNFISRSFDLTFIYKDKTFISITSIDSKSMDYLREFIDSRNICFIQTTQNINWTNLLKTISEDAISFYEDGGWSSLQPLREEADQEESTESEISEPSSISSSSRSGTESSVENESQESTVTEDSEDIVDLNEIDSDEESSEEERDAKKRRR
ncbi:Global transcriptional regulator, cell division control protein, partial [Pseudoloma neurophilia]